MVYPTGTILAAEFPAVSCTIPAADRAPDPLEYTVGSHSRLLRTASDSLLVHQDFVRFCFLPFGEVCLPAVASLRLTSSAAPCFSLRQTSSSFAVSRARALTTASCSFS